ncbi:hypothetical protein U0070_008362 [Myodes glareolus]|uniref:Uncharacterized protein n=1 Tax=Myodes glareolus TaxID=447135 RepID=A0AAW0IXS2_MYOGA
MNTEITCTEPTVPPRSVEKQRPSAALLMLLAEAPQSSPQERLEAGPPCVAQRTHIPSSYYLTAVVEVPVGFPNEEQADRQRMAQRQCQPRHCSRGSKMVSQVLERLKMVEKDEDGGCMLTPQGQRDLDKITRRMAAANESIRTKDAGMYISTMCLPDAGGGHQRTSDALQLELLMVVSHHLDAWTKLVLNLQGTFVKSSRVSGNTLGTVGSGLAQYPNLKSVNEFIARNINKKQIPQLGEAMENVVRPSTDRDATLPSAQRKALVLALVLQSRKLKSIKFVTSATKVQQFSKPGYLGEVKHRPLCFMSCQLSGLLPSPLTTSQLQQMERSQVIIEGKDLERRSACSPIQHLPPTKDLLQEERVPEPALAYNHTDEDFAYHHRSFIRRWMAIQTETHIGAPD